MILFKLTTLSFLFLGLFSFCRAYEELTKDIKIYNGSDFKEVVDTSLFVDKTLLIKRFFDVTKYGSGILVLTPRYFGKSTNLNMLKRFFEMNIDESGQLEVGEKTTNYNLFRNNYLNIYRLNPFFNKHFGKYPVIFIDYKPLSVVSTIEELLGVFYRDIMMQTFLQHEYLFNDKYIWTLNDSSSFVCKEKFKMYIKPELSYKLTEPDIQTGFSFLAKLLEARFERKVIVLLDNYDAFVESKLYEQNQHIFHLISAVNCDLLRCESVERSLVTGVRRSSGPAITRNEILPSCIQDCASHHNLWGYFGLSGVELEKLLQPIIKDDEHRERVMAKIVHDYAGYSVATFEAGNGESGQMLDTQTCSVWSVVQFMEKELAVDNFSSLV